MMRWHQRAGTLGDDSRWGIESKCINNPDWYEYDVSHDNLMVQISPSGNHFIKCSIVPVIAASPEGEAPRWYLKWPLWLCTGCLYSLSLIKSLRSLLLQISATFQSHQSYKKVTKKTKYDILLDSLTSSNVQISWISVNKQSSEMFNLTVEKM